MIVLSILGAAGSLIAQSVEAGPPTAIPPSFTMALRYSCSICGR